MALNFLQALIFAIFPVICKYKFPQTKVTANILPQRNLLNLPPKNTVLRNCVFSIKTCLFCSETKRSTMKNWFYIGYAYCSIVSKYVFPLHILNEKQKYYQYWVQDFIKTTKNNSWKEKSICSNLQKLVPAKHTNCQTAKINSCKHFEPHHIKKWVASAVIKKNWIPACSFDKSKKMLLAHGHLFAFVCLDPCLGKLAYKITCQTSKCTCSGQVERTFFK